MPHCIHHDNQEGMNAVGEDRQTTFRDWLLEEMRRRKWNQAEVARRTGILPSVISRWVSRDWLPDATSCFKLSEAFGVDFNYVLRMAGHDPVQTPVATGKHERLWGKLKRVDLTDPTRESTLDGILTMWLEADEEKRNRQQSEAERSAHEPVGTR
jgi:transcriptional regulator with XRE-family HTH domain